ncbi:hypothetical protein FXF51_56895 [Nonomuraea sp. PA05]|uniref:hypothetical protein n=1 Tax=Nonomuraea sp. PA05 TaxID=2604466 RepID=UPI0011D58682|nr:hypothetical protein [Nonomuraea sp. PA05]TYB50259.1 hypothetical protein FXF51_56895 [Nonomuraea sp. PA05]
MFDWLKKRRDLIGELEETRGQAADAVRLLADTVAERDRAEAALVGEQAAHKATQRLLEAFEADTFADPFDAAMPRTMAEELAAMRKHVTALEEQLHRLQQANMAFDRR